MKTIFLLLTLLPFLSFSQKSDLNGYKYIYIYPLYTQSYPYFLNAESIDSITSSIVNAFTSKGLIIANGYSKNNVPDDLKANPCLLLTATPSYIITYIIGVSGLKLKMDISNCNNEKIFSHEVSGKGWLNKACPAAIKKMTEEIEAISYSFNSKLTSEFKVKVNPDYTIKNSGLTEDSIKNYLDKNKTDAIEGIYKSYRAAANDNSPLYKFGVIKKGHGLYQAIIIKSGSPIWRQGEIKMVLEITDMGMRDISVQYYVLDKSKVETFASFSNNRININFAKASNNNEDSISSFIKTYPSLNTEKCSDERLITTSKGVSDVQSDTLQIQIKGNKWLSLHDSILVKTPSGKEIHFPFENVWGYEDCESFKRYFDGEYYAVNQIGSLIIYFQRYHNRHHSGRHYYFSKTLDDKIYSLDRGNIKKQFKDNPCFLEKLDKVFKSYRDDQDWYDTKGYKFALIFDQCKS